MSVPRRRSMLPRWETEKPQNGQNIMDQVRRLGASSSTPSLRSATGKSARRASFVVLNQREEKSGLLPMVQQRPDSRSSTTAPPSSSGASSRDKDAAKLPKCGYAADLGTQAFMLSRRLNLDYHEVNFALKELQKVPHNLTNGGIDRASFTNFLQRLFEVRYVPDHIFEGAYKESKASAGPVDLDKFFVWYRDNMFTAIAGLTADQGKQQADDMVSSLANKHDISVVELDKIKKRFDQFDLDKSGEIEYEEFEQMMGKLLGLSKSGDIPECRMKKFWREIDRDGSSSVDFSEFTEWYLKYFSNGTFGGPVEAFYASFSPDVQRQKGLEQEAKLASDDSPMGHEALPPSAGMSVDDFDASHRQQLQLLGLGKRRSTVE